MGRAKLFSEATTVLTQDCPSLEFNQSDEATCLDRMVRDYAALSRITGIRCDLFERAMNLLRDYPAYGWTAEMCIKACSLFLDTAFRWREVNSVARFRRWLDCRDAAVMPVTAHLYSTPLNRVDEYEADVPANGSFRAAVLILNHIKKRITDPIFIKEEEREAAIKARLEAETRAISLLSLHLNALSEKAPETTSLPLRRLILRYALPLQRPEHRKEMVGSALHDSLPHIQSFLI